MFWFGARVDDRACLFPCRQTFQFFLKRKESNEPNTMFVLWFHARIDERAPLPLSSSQTYFDIMLDKWRSFRRRALQSFQNMRGQGSLCFAHVSLNERRSSVMSCSQPVFENWREGRDLFSRARIVSLFQTSPLFQTREI